jgi:hypothetical protein
VPREIVALSHARNRSVGQTPSREGVTTRDRVEAARKLFDITQRKEKTGCTMLEGLDEATGRWSDDWHPAHDCLDRAQTEWLCPP